MPESKVKDPRILKAIRLVNANFDQNFDFNHLAKTLNLSPSRLRQLFKREAGISFRKYLRQARMRQAQHLLETTYLSVKEIAKQVGICDSSRFVKDFEKQFGMPPGKYRNAYLLRKEKAASQTLISAPEQSRIG
ncbi:MAG TPA: AraC family transcriptional regulator [Pyrinomonadaceae bacterium]|nr:AraC family transcriptional regulator [Pyrinomonadaceae bacterium]